jgi:hypothetical protein
MIDYNRACQDVRKCESIGVLLNHYQEYQVTDLNQMNKLQPVRAD